MAKIKLELDKRSVINGRSQIRVRLTNKNTSLYIPTGAYVESDFFTNNLHTPIKGKGAYYNECSELVAGIVRKYESAIFDLTRSGNITEMLAKDIKLYVDGAKKVANNNSMFLEFFSFYGSEARSEKTRKDFAYVQRVIEQYCDHAGIHALSFGMVDYNFLIAMEKWLNNGQRGEHVLYKTMSYIRVVYKEAIRQKRASAGDNPFVYYKIRRPEQQCDIHTLSLDAMRKLIALDFTNHPAEKTLNITRDSLLASFYLCGANLIDMFNMGKPVDNHAVFVRHKLTGKTKRPVRIYIDEELSALVDKYSGKNTLFCFKDSYASFTTYQSRVDHRCVTLSQMIGEKVDFATMRRTWATYASKLKVEQHVVKKSIGHKDKDVLFVHYDNYDWDNTRQANRKVLDYIKGAAV